MTTRSPSLSICVPTHSGRAGVLDELLERLAAELDQAEFEVCVSDNGSRDETSAVIARHLPRFDGRLRYHRHPRDLGMPVNVLSVVEMASGDFCWLFGSDDAPARGAVREVLEVLSRFPDVTGMVVGHRRVQADDLDRAGYVVVPEPYPPQRQLTRFTARREIADNLGYIMYFTSNQVIHRASWNEVVRTEHDVVLRMASGPHLYVLGRMAARRPDWLWCPRPLVLSREAAVFLMDDDVLGPRPAAAMRRMLSDLDRIWSRLYGRRTYEYRASMYKALRHVWDAENVLGVRMQSPGAREYAANVSCARRFWWCRWFWRVCLPRLLVPVDPLRQHPRRCRAMRMRALAPGAANVTATAALPSVMYANYSARLGLRIDNHGTATLSSAAPCPIRVAARWQELDTGADVAVLAGGAALWPPLRGGRGRSMELLLVPPERPGTYRLALGVHQMRVGWLASGPPGLPNAIVHVKGDPPEPSTDHGSDRGPMRLPSDR